MLWVSFSSALLLVLDAVVVPVVVWSGAAPSGAVCAPANGDRLHRATRMALVNGWRRATRVRVGVFTEVSSRFLVSGAKHAGPEMTPVAFLSLEY